MVKMIFGISLFILLPSPSAYSLFFHLVFHSSTSMTMTLPFRPLLFSTSMEEGVKRGRGEEKKEELGRREEERRRGAAEEWL